MDNKDLKINIYENNTDNPKAPSFKGYATIGGVVHEVALWPAKSGKKGSYSGFMKEKQDRPQAGNAYKEDGSDVPF